MKILSGDYKGLSIITKKRTNYRPTQSRIRKSIFDILKPFSYLNVLDLFSGTGIIGFENILAWTNENNLWRPEAIL